jgi:hypothetical protein
VRAHGALFAQHAVVRVAHLLARVEQSEEAEDALEERRASLAKCAGEQA